MFDFLKRGRLVRRGLASRKTRRRRARNDLVRNLESRVLAVCEAFHLRRVC